jgi:hypothetical protein
MPVTTFTHGRKTVIFVDGYNLTRVFRESAGPYDRAEHDTTTYGTDDSEFQAGDRSGSITLAGLWKPPTPPAVDPLVDPTVVTIGRNGSDIGAFAQFGHVFSTSYETPASRSDIIPQNIDFRCDDGLWDGRFLHKHQPESASGSAASIDNGIATIQGWAIFGHATAFTGSIYQIFVEHSPDGTAWSILYTSPVLTTPAGVYLSGVGTVERFRRIRWSQNVGSSVTFTGGLATR